MICPPCKNDDHWGCIDVNGGPEGEIFIQVSGRNPGTIQPDPSQHTGYRPRRCDCQHKDRSIPENRIRSLDG